MPLRQSARTVGRQSQPNSPSIIALGREGEHLIPAGLCGGSFVNCILMKKIHKCGNLHLTKIFFRKKLDKFHKSYIQIKESVL